VLSEPGHLLPVAASRSIKFVIELEEDRVVRAEIPEARSPLPRRC
jgi:hypothetical protein